MGSDVIDQLMCLENFSEPQSEIITHIIQTQVISLNECYGQGIKTIEFRFQSTDRILCVIRIIHIVYICIRRTRFE